MKLPSEVFLSARTSVYAKRCYVNCAQETTAVYTIEMRIDEYSINIFSRDGPFFFPILQRAGPL